MRKHVLTAAYLVIMLYSQCTTDHATGSLNTDSSPTVSGKLQYQDGSQADGCTVELRKRNILADISEGGSEIENKVITDQTGRFSFSTPEAGTYVIEASDSKIGAFIDSVRIESADSSVDLKPATLEPTGTIRGNVVLDSNGNSEYTYILIFGIDRFVKVNTDGSFLFPDLPPGHYTLRLLAAIDDYSTKDTSDIEVISAETTIVDMIHLSYTGIPVPQRLDASYDTLRRAVTLTWAKENSAIIKGYFVYRRNFDSNSIFGEPLNSTALTDTCFFDSTGIQDQTYEYCVAATGSITGSTGQKSNRVSVHIASWFECDTVCSFLMGSAPGTFGFVSSFVVYRDEKLYLLDGIINNHRIEVFDTNLHFLTQMSLSKEHRFYYDFSIDNNSTLFFCLPDTTTGNNGGTSAYYRIFRQNADATVPFPTSIRLNRVSHFDVNDSLLFIACDSTISVYDYNDSMIIKKVFPGTIKLRNIHAADADRIIFADWLRRRLFITDYNGTTVMEMNLPNNKLLYDVAFDAQNQRIYYFTERFTKPLHPECDYHTEGILHAFDLNGLEIANYSIGVVNEQVSINLTENHTIFITVGSDLRKCNLSRLIKLKPLLR